MSWQLSCRNRIQPMPDALIRAAAAQELLKRRQHAEIWSTGQGIRAFEPAKHHQLIINEIEAFLSRRR